VRALGLDIGAERIGVAVSDPGGSVAAPVTVLDARRLAGDPTAFVRLLEDYEPECLVVGIPITLAGAEGPQAAAVRTTAERLASLAGGLPIEYWDERLSSVEARRAMHEAGMSEREQRGALDKVAAAIVLQGWLDARRAAAQERR
jgi:putative Holliday junction resolvase